MGTPKNTKPFHESIVDAINSCAGSQFGLIKLTTLINLALETKISANHDEILEAFRQFEFGNKFLFNKLVEKLNREKKEVHV